MKYLSFVMSTACWLSTLVLLYCVGIAKDPSPSSILCLVNFVVCGLAWAIKHSSRLEPLIVVSCTVCNLLACLLGPFDETIIIYNQVAIGINSVNVLVAALVLVHLERQDRQLLLQVLLPHGDI